MIPVILGVDPSSKTGSVIIQGEDVLWRATLKSDAEDYLIKGRDTASTLIDKCLEHKVTHICIEDYAMNAKFRLVDMVKLGTIIRWHLRTNFPDVPMYNVPPTSLKLWATRKGKASKADMKAHCIRRFDFTGNNDEVDAFLLAKYLQHGITDMLELKPHFFTDAYTPVQSIAQNTGQTIHNSLK